MDLHDFDDIACGTGAVLLYLADNGIMADGTDLSEAMCRVCSEKAKSKGYNLNIFPANMTEFNILGLAVRYGQEF